MINIENENFLNYEECENEKQFFKVLDRYKKDDKLEYYMMITNDKIVRMIDIGLSDTDIIKLNKQLDALEIIQVYGYDVSNFSNSDDESDLFKDNIYYEDYE